MTKKNDVFSSSLVDVHLLKQHLNENGAAAFYIPLSFTGFAWR